VTVLCGGSVARKQNSTRTRNMSCIAAASISRKYFSREISEKQYFSREIREKKIKNQISFFYSFGILTTKMTTKMYTKLMMKYYQKWAEFGIFWGKTSKNLKNEVKIL
jgi:hypothetical protein